MKNLSIYIHIPFCSNRCKYCRFASFGNTDNLMISKYIDFLCAEIYNFNGDYIIDTIYFGGGTPGILNKNHLDKIFSILKQRFIFAQNIEISFEVNPKNITKSNLVLWHSFGINRISIGVQTLNQFALKEIGRDEKGDIFNALDDINHFTKKDDLKISMDFIIGLPFVQKLEIRDDIASLISKYDFINHISLYMLEEYYNLSEIENSKYDKITYPKNWKELGLKEDEFLDEYSAISAFLENRGYRRYEISNFAKSGYECKHNLGYWNHKEYIGFGLGAHSFIDNIRIANSDKLEEYYKGEGRYKEQLSESEKEFEKLIFMLRTKGIDIGLVDILNKDKLDSFIKDGYLIKNESKISLTNKGILIIDYIITEIIQ